MKINNRVLTNSTLINFNLTTDPLLKKDGIFYNGTKLNIYKMLVLCEDFTTNNKGQFIKKMPFLLDNNNKIFFLLNKVPAEYKRENFSKLRELFCNYQASAKLRVETLRSFIQKKYYPITFVRVLSKLIDEKEFYDIIKESFITDFSRFNQIKLITDTKKLPNFLFYLFGVILGDGTINKERIKIVDGDERKAKLRFSKEFLKKINEKVRRIFKTNIGKVEKIKGKNGYELRFNNKWLCYFLNSLFGLEFGRKINPKIQRELKLTNHQKNLIMRGLFDTDGSVDGRRVTMATRYETLLADMLLFLKEADINFSLQKTTKSREFPLFKVTVHSRDALKYAQMIGFSHPRKSLELKQLILSDSLTRKVKLAREKKLYQLGFYLRPIANVKLHVTPPFFKLKNKKRHQLIKLFNDRFNCDFEKAVRENKCINNKEITKKFTDIFKYEPERRAMQIPSANKLLEEWLQIWN